MTPFPIFFHSQQRKNVVIFRSFSPEIGNIQCINNNELFQFTKGFKGRFHIRVFLETFLLKKEHNNQMAALSFSKMMLVGLGRGGVMGSGVMGARMFSGSCVSLSNAELMKKIKQLRLQTSAPVIDCKVGRGLWC